VLAEKWGKWPHELALGRNDAPVYTARRIEKDQWELVPNSDIPMAFLIFDLQCAIFRTREQEKELNKQQVGKTGKGRWGPPPQSKGAGSGGRESKSTDTI
jgi:hypothetical protein